MATTTNYSWTTPDDTDLVKDGAAAIRSLGTAIDTTVFTNAGAAIAKSIVDAKGDLIAGTADNTVARLAVGANDTILVADSSEATGLKWAAPASGATYIGCLAFRTSSLTFSYNTWTAVGLDDELNDSDGFHDNSTNNTRITIPSGKGGKYLINGQMLFNQKTEGSQQIRVTKNGGAAIMGTIDGFGGYITCSISQIASLTAGDYIELEAFSDSSGGNTIQPYMTQTNFFQVIYLGA